MGSPEVGPPRGQLANVSAALIFEPGGDAASPLLLAHARLLARLFEDVFVVVDDPLGIEGVRDVVRPHPSDAFGDLRCALAAAREARVLVLDAALQGVTPALLLGLTAWPESACVAPRVDGAVKPLCAVYLRDDVLRADEMSTQPVDLQTFVARLECGLLEGSDLAALLEPGAPLS